MGVSPDNSNRVWRDATFVILDVDDDPYPVGTRLGFIDASTDEARVYIAVAESDGRQTPDLSDDWNVTGTPILPTGGTDYLPGSFVRTGSLIFEANHPTVLFLQIPIQPFGAPGWISKFLHSVKTRMA